MRVKISLCLALSFCISATLSSSHLVSASTSLSIPPPPVPAFPGCEGYGCETRGGRGGIVVIVSNLNDAGPGSLRQALMMTEPRIVVFKVSGTIYLQAPLELTEANSYVTVAGQTAPGDGIAIASAAGAEAWLGLGGTQYGNGKFHDGVFRHLRFRSSPSHHDNADVYRFSISLWAGTHQVVLDHNSFTWSNDQIVNQGWGGDTHDITWQWNIIGEGGGQNAGSFFGGQGGSGNRNTSFHHNYIAHTGFRNYMVIDGEWDFINNVNYNTFRFDFHFTDHAPSSVAVSPDIINHYFKQGPDQNPHAPFDITRGLTPKSDPYIPVSLYLKGNKLVDISGAMIYGEDDQESMIRTRAWEGYDPPNYELNERGAHTPPPQYPVSIQSVDAGKDSVLANAGPRPLDTVDARLLGDFYDGGGYDPDNIGQFPDLRTYDVSLDADQDGMPDEWELAHGLDPEDGMDHNKDRDGDGYTNIEEWIHSIGTDLNPEPTFVDVPFNHWAHDAIEALYQAGYVAGCSSDPLMYCPEATMTRVESAVFVERGVHGVGYLPGGPAQQIFADVPLGEWFAKWATGLWEDGYTAGCGTDPLVYCPLREHTRTEGTVFFLRMLNGSEYLPPPAAGLFTDVDRDFWGAKWIEAAYGAGLIPACATSPELRFCPDDPLDRAMGAYMMVQAKGPEIP